MVTTPMEITQKMVEVAKAAGFSLGVLSDSDLNAPANHRFFHPVALPNLYVFKHESTLKRLTHEQITFLMGHTYAEKCQYPAWDEGKPTGLYCEAPVAVGAYCVTHARACYRFSFDKKLRPLAPNYHGPFGSGPGKGISPPFKMATKVGQ